MATDTIRIPTTWKPLLTQLKQAVTAEQGEQILREAIAALTTPPDELPKPAVPERVRLILRNGTLASVVIGTQRYRIDKVLDLPREEAAALEAALTTQQQGYTPNPTRIERLP